MKMPHEKKTMSEDVCKKEGYDRKSEQDRMRTENRVKEKKKKNVCKTRQLV